MNFFNLILLQIITLELSNMNNNCAVEINRNHSAQAFEDYSVVDTMVQVKVWIMFHLLKTSLPSGIREVAECPEQHVYQGKH